MHKNYVSFFGLLLVVSITISCGTRGAYISPGKDGAPSQDIDISTITDAIPRVEPHSKYGNPESYRVNGKNYYVMADSKGYVQRGIASWYGKKFHGQRASSGEIYNMYAMTAAHTSLPLPTYVKVTNLENDRSVVVRVNDRGPFHNNRLIDLSYVAAKKLGITAKGTAVVEVRAIDPRTPISHSTPKIITYNDQNYSLYLQAGAFISRTNAEQLRNMLKDKFNNVEINAHLNDKQKIYRVRIGPLLSVETADKLADQIIQLGIASPHIVVK